MIVRKAGLRSRQKDGRVWLYYSDAGGLTHYGAYVETLQPIGPMQVATRARLIVVKRFHYGR